jgi:2-hydroxyglutarate dehydrogenase
MDGTPPERCDVAVVGAGIVGLALARELSTRGGAPSVCVLEREERIATHQTGHNSGVIHAGVYYAPGSLKAELCVAGAREMYEFCEQRGIAHERCGKLIVATSPHELERLDELERRGRANGVELRRLGPREIAEIEPHARGVAALHSPGTGIADFAAVAHALADDVRAAGGAVVTGCAVTGVSERGGGGLLAIEHARGVLEARRAVFCAGAWSDRLAVAAGASPDPRIVPFRGAYLRLRPQRRSLVRALIYPVPDPRLPFLGVHLTKHVDGDVLIGPTALLAPGLDAYSLRRVRPRELAATLAWPGTWRLARRHWRAGAQELRHALSRRALVHAAARFVPELAPRDVEFAFAGVRAQALGRDGSLLDDFAYSVAGGALHVRNAPSPAATASLAIARRLADEVERGAG